MQEGMPQKVGSGKRESQGGFRRIAGAQDFLTNT